MFYYGKEFGSKRHKTKKGKLEQEEFHPLSVAIPHAMGEEIEKAQRGGENADVESYLSDILGSSDDNPMTSDELADIVKKGA